MAKTIPTGWQFVTPVDIDAIDEALMADVWITKNQFTQAHALVEFRDRLATGLGLPTFAQKYPDKMDQADGCSGGCP